MCSHVHIFMPAVGGRSAAKQMLANVPCRNCCFEIATAASGLAMTNTECVAMVVLLGRVKTRPYSSAAHFRNNDKFIVFMTVNTYEHMLICSYVFMCYRQRSQTPRPV